MRKGFTLVELSIVLVIMGLLLGGILMGQSLVDSAKTRKLLGQVSQYNAAVRLFKSKWHQLPGDFSKGYTIWGRACLSPFSTNYVQCGGNANGVVELNSNTDAREASVFWRHLELENMIPHPAGGQYSGVANTNLRGDGVQWPVGLTIPGTPYRNSGFMVGVMVPGTRNAFILGRETTNWNDGSVYGGTEALAIDQKLDDGFPLTGKVLGLAGRDENLVFSGCHDGTRYVVTKTCRQIFEFDNE